MKGLDLYLLSLLPIGICGTLLGGYSSVAVDQETEKLAKDALEKFNAASDGNTKTYSKLLSVQEQVVAGTNYKFSIEVTNSNNEEEICELVLWVKLSGQSQLTSSKCQKKRVKRIVTGEWHSVSPHDEDLLQALRFAMKELNAQSNNLNKFSAEEVIEASTAVVQGNMYFIKVRVEETSCRKDEDVIDCPVLDFGMKQICKFKVLYQHWKKDPNKYNLLDSSCEEKDPTHVGS